MKKRKKETELDFWVRRVEECFSGYDCELVDEDELRRILSPLCAKRPPHHSEEWTYFDKAREYVDLVCTGMNASDSAKELAVELDRQCYPAWECPGDWRTAVSIIEKALREDLS